MTDKEELEKAFKMKSLMDMGILPTEAYKIAFEKEFKE